MNTILILTAILVIAVIWWERNKYAVRRRAVSHRRNEAQRPCYHGITRHDPDWEV